MKALEWSQAFSHYKLYGSYPLPWKPEFQSDLAKTYCSFSHTPMVLQIKFDRNCPSGLRDIHV